MKMSLLANFRLYEREFERPNVFRLLTKKDIGDLSVGGFTFVVSGHPIQFDWDAHSCSESGGIFHLETGRGPFFNDFELPDYWDEEYAEMGLTRDQITAKFLASTTKIEDFYINLYDSDTDVEDGIGNNEDFDAALYIELIAVSVEEIETGDSHDVDESVITEFNGNASNYHEFLNNAYNAFRKEWYASRSGIDPESECLGYTIRQFENCEFVDDDYMVARHPEWSEKRLLIKNAEASA